MKKLGLLLLIGAVTVGLTACGGTEEKTNSTADNNEETTDQQEEAVEVAASGDTEFTITATNWDFASDKALVVKKGTNVKLNLVNAEGVHTIGNDELGFDLSSDAPVEFTADTVGEFELICSTICGSMEDHEAMTITLKVIE